MNQTQAIVTALVRVSAAALLLGSFIFPAQIPNFPTEESSVSIPVQSWTSFENADSGIKALDFAGGTAVHFNPLGVLALLFCLFALIFAKRIAVWITPAYHDPAQQNLPRK